MVSSNDRLLQLIIKGILYESCVDFCQQKATGAKHADHIKFTNLLSQSDFSDSDLSLLSWLQSIPGDTFSCPFEQRSLNVDVERLKNPTLETSWTEHMLITPIKPNIFPHSAMPNTRPKGKAYFLKSNNLQYNMLVRWDARTKDSSTKRLMFQVLFFFHNFLQNPFQKLFQFIS